MRRSGTQGASVVGVAVGSDAHRRAISDAAIGFVPPLAETLDDALALLGSGARAVVIAGPDAAVVLDRATLSRSLAELRGWATLDATAATDVERARTIRRALADGRMKAVEIGQAHIVVCDAAMPRERALSIFSRALGPYAVNLAVEIVDDELGPGGRRVVSDVLACVRAVARAAGPAAVLLVLLGATRTIALAFARPR